jgi:hypothetical protein
LARVDAALKHRVAESDFRQAARMTAGTCRAGRGRRSCARTCGAKPMDAHRIELFLHAGLGSAALLSFWIAALAQKGGRVHKLAGKVYVPVMAGLLLPAVPLSWRALLHFSTVFGLFLFYLLLITATALWRGWTAVRRKRDFDAYARTRGARALAFANIAGGAAILGVGAASGQVVLMGFSLVGILAGRDMLRLAETGPAHPRWWMQSHLSAMIGCGVATHIAFLLIGLPPLLPATWNGPLLQSSCWLAPLLVAALARRHLTRKYLPLPAPRAPALATAVRA